MPTPASRRRSRVRVPTLPRIAAVLALVLAGTACMTERDLLTQRIQSRIELFQTYPPATQVRLRNGHVEIGDTRDMVWIALGEPDRKLQRRTASGTNEVWSYTATDTRTVTVPGEAHGYRYGSRHGRYYGSDTVWVDTTQTLEYERLRVEFDGSAVVAVETLSPPVH